MELLGRAGEEARIHYHKQHQEKVRDTMKREAWYGMLQRLESWGN